MLTEVLPATPEDVLNIPEQNVPEIVRDLLKRQALTPLLKTLHDDLHSGDAGRALRSDQALRHLGFTD